MHVRTKLMIFLPGFLLNKWENDISNLHLKFRAYIMYDIYKMAD